MTDRGGCMVMRNGELMLDEFAELCIAFSDLRSRLNVVESICFELGWFTEEAVGKLVLA